MSVYAVANHIKFLLRNEPILPSDLSFLSSGNGGEIASFIPKDSQTLVDNTITMLIWLTVICLIIQFVDGRRCVIPFHWWRPFRNMKTVAAISRVLLRPVQHCTTMLVYVDAQHSGSMGAMSGHNRGEILPSFGIPSRGCASQRSDD